MFAITRRATEDANGIRKGEVLYAAIDIDWKTWVDEKTLLFASKQEAERQLGPHHIGEEDAKVEEVKTVGEFWREIFRQPMYAERDVHRSLQVLDTTTTCGQFCVDEIIRYREFLCKCNDMNHPKVSQPILDSLRAQLEIFFYG